ncbi:MAG: acetyl-CoA carboxylase, biotin carboxyl carrier protein [Halobacteriovoraceae bacterium]|nr:acetyl-CoA carboxylase, biotin carboxyl carrier protein [Halobacteriovoraceae bacterium]|tara:strand:+ start:120042 stop:120476 length:435 start_codon:yes stop_codon:yes gene_type:complete
MDLNILKEFIQLAKDEGVSELKYETKEQKLSVSFGTSVATVAQPAPIVAHSTKAATAAPAESSGEQFHEIKSPFVGTFYASPAPDKGAYVKVGDKVSKGQTLCILEAMKIMNEIESDASGEIVEICVENESLVEFGQTLFKVRV